MVSAQETVLGRRRGGWLFVLPCLAMYGCEDQTGAVSTSPLDVWEIDPTPVMQLGQIDGAPEEVFSRISGIGFLGDGGLVVGNAASATLRVFDTLGALASEFGGEGQGPGEFAYLGEVQVVGGDTVLVYDPVAFRLSIFARSGQRLGTVQMTATDGAPEVYLGRDGQGRHLVSLIRPTRRDPARVTADAMEVRRYDRDGGDWVSLGTFSGMRRLRSPVPLSPHFVGAVLGDTAFVTDGLLPEVRALAPTGESPRTIDASEAVWTSAEAHRRLAESIHDTALTQRLQDVRAGSSWDSVPRFSEVLPDPMGHLWLKRYDPSTDSHWVNRRRTGGRWLVSTTRGTAVAEVTVPTGFRLMAVGLNRVVGVQIDDLGVERVLVYSLRRNRPGA